MISSLLNCEIQVNHVLVSAPLYCLHVEPLLAAAGAAWRLCGTGVPGALGQS